MSRKNLSDLVREELQKPAEADPSSQTEPQTEDNSAETSAARTKRLTKADLEVMIQELQAGLKAAEAKETSLQQQIVELQQALEQRDVPAPVAEIDAAGVSEKLKAELETAKQDALLLAEANEKLNQEIKALKQDNHELKAQLEQGVRSQTKAITRTKQPPLHVAAPAARPVAPNKPSSGKFESWCYD